MKSRAILAFLVLASAAIFSEEKINADTILQMFQRRDLTALQSIPRASLLQALPAEQANRLALAAAKSLSISGYMGAIKESIYKDFTRPPASDTPEEAECRRQSGINMAAADLLQMLIETGPTSQKRVCPVTDSQLLPYLIGALDHPDEIFVGSRCFCMLVRLTRHESGKRYWYGRYGPEADKERHTEISAWWKAWWERNKEKHPIFDAELEAAARAEMLRIAKRIESEVKPKHPELWKFLAQEASLIHRRPYIFGSEYNPGEWSLIELPSAARDKLPWIFISSRFDDDDLPPEVDEPTPERPCPPEALKGHVKTAYSSVLKGTGIVIEVMVASTDESLIDDLAAASMTNR